MAPAKAAVHVARRAVERSGAMAKKSKVSEPHASPGGGIASLFVRRPVLAIVLNLLIVIAGLAAWRGIEVRELPNIDRPVITVRTNYTGATPDTIDKEVTSVIEGAVARVPGVVSISSSSSAGQSQVTVEFDQKTDINVVGKHPASPAPKRKRVATIVTKLQAHPVAAVKKDHHSTIRKMTRRGPSQSPR